MDKPPRLKSDIELKVANQQNGSPSLVAPDADAITSEPDKATNSAVQKQSSESDRPAREAAKKQNEQAFLRAYRGRQIRIRTTFAVLTVLVLFSLISALNMVFKKSEIGKAAIDGVMPVLMAACVGERDLAYYQVSNLQFANDKGDAHLVDQRAKILNRSISELENTGRPAIFSRLGTEKMLMGHGDRAAGLKYGDYLIDKYPDLASNYCWRAKVDFDNGDFAHAVQGYEQFAKILERSPLEVGQHWSSQLPRAVWSCVNSGRLAEAQRFNALSEKLGENPEDVKALKSRMLLSSCAALAPQELKKTDFWNPDLENQIQQRLARAKTLADSIDFSNNFSTADWDTDNTYSDTNTYLLKRDLLFDISLLGDHSFARNEIHRRHNYYRAPLEAQLALSENNPQAALDVLRKADRIKDLYRSIDLNFVRASAWQKLHYSQQAIDAADSGLEFYSRSNSLSERYFLPLHMIKARALYDSASYEKALAECEQVLSVNPHLIEPRLIKMRCLNKLNRTAEAGKERKNIIEELQIFSTSGGLEATP